MGRNRRRHHVARKAHLELLHGVLFPFKQWRAVGVRLGKNDRFRSNGNARANSDQRRIAKIRYPVVDSTTFTAIEVEPE